MQNILKRNLLKYSAGQHIFCPKCNAIADFRRWVIWESPAGQNGAHCAACHRDILAKVHDDRPHAYLETIGWRFDTLAKFDKPAPKAKPAKPKLMTPAAVRRAIFAGHKALGNCAKKDRIFPAITHAADLPLHRNDDGEWSNGQITAQYVAEYCRLNHLTA